MFHIETYYKTQSQKLLEFSALLASFEVRLALNLDEDDFDEYKKSE